MKLEFSPDLISSKIVGVGRNYADHAAELGNEVPKEPLLFLKAPSSLLPPRHHPADEASAPLLKPGGEPKSTPPKQGGEHDWPAIVLPPQSQQVEHEAELAVIIGRDCKNISDDEDPFQYVHGYSCLNDVTARDLQKSDGQFARAKSFDTFCPIGPHIETELDVSDLRVVCRVNGEIKQDGRTSQMVFPVEFLIRYISRQMTLKRGDVIATGTPSGVSKLNPGDVCEVEIEGIGVLTNSVS